MADSLSFERPPLATTGDRDTAQIPAAVGSALSTWENAERSFAAIFSKLVSPSGSGFAAQRAYGNIVAAAVRRQMIESAAEVFFRNFPDEQAQAELKELMKLHGAATSRRNDFAHGIIGGDIVDDKFWHFLVPNTWSSKSRDMHLQIEYRYSSSQILEFDRKFSVLGGRASQLRENLNKIYRAAPDIAREPY